MSNAIRLQSARSVWRQSERDALDDLAPERLQSARSVWRQSVMLLSVLPAPAGCNLHGACGGKGFVDSLHKKPIPLQSARSVWRQRWMPARLPATERSCCNLHGACGGKEVFTPLREQKRRLQSARSVWRQRGVMDASIASATVAICTERVEAKLK